MEKTTIRYVITHVAKNGLRRMVGPMQGRYTYATKKEAIRMLLLTNWRNSRESIVDLYGSEPLKVNRCLCYPVRFDPQQIYFD